MIRLIRIIRAIRSISQEGSITLFRRKKGSINIWISIGVACLLLFLAASTLFGMTFAIIQRFTGAQASLGDIGVSSQCYLPDYYWTNSSIGEIPDTKTVLKKLGQRNIMPRESDIDLILKKTREAGVNPAVSIATWGKEQNFGNRDYAFGAKEPTTFEDQLSKHIQTLVDAKDNKGYYANRPVGKPIQVWWIDIYTPASDTRNDVPEDRKIFFTFLKQLVPNQVVCPAGGVPDGSLDFRNFGVGSDGIVGKWQNIAEVFNILGGANKSNIESQIVTTSFMGVSVSVNRMIVNQLKQVESDIKASGTDYKIRQKDTGAFVWRKNVNNPGEISPHATGLAIDVNWGSNPNAPRETSCQVRDQSCCPHDIPKAVSDAFEKNGFFWGAKFKNICDSMHFQYGGNWN